MPIYCNGKVQFRHLDGGVIHTIMPEEIEFEQVSSDEGQMGPKNTYAATYDHSDEQGREGRITWTLIEYPIGAQNWKETAFDKLKIIQDFDFGLEPEAEAPNE